MTDVVEQTDGRRARRERGRLAVLDAMVDLIREGHAPPTTEEIADRAGVSVASLFRYFPTLEELQRQTSARFMERYAPLLDVRDSAIGPFGERVDRYVSARIVLYETIGPVARFARGRSFSRPQLVANLAEMHRRHADVTRHHFAAELRARTPAAADDAVALVTSITSFDAWELLRSDLGRSRAQVRRAWTAGIDSLLRAPTTVG